MMYKDYNNVLFIQDSALANAYTQEFNMMWGSTTATPNASLAKFGTEKTDLGLHSFVIGGKSVYLYFSPSDGSNSQIVNAIETANTDLYLGMYDLTEATNAYDISAKNSAGVYTHAILDQYSNPGSAYTTIAGLGPSNFIEYTGAYIYHNKMLIVDPSDTCSDPQVETGSENWTSSGTSDNDENILIIHSDTLANIYYQSFYQDFVGLGGTALRLVGGCGTTGIPAAPQTVLKTVIYPNPASNELNISSPGIITSVTISSLLGQTLCSHEYNTEHVNLDVSGLPAGVYFIKINGTEAMKFLKQ